MNGKRIGWATVALLLARTAKIEAQQEGWSKAAFDTAPFTPGISHRQDVCEYFDTYHNGTVELRDALRGLALRPFFSTGSEYFKYDADKGIDPRNPGISVAIMDELAQRAGFTWRDSFGVIHFPPKDNSTFTENLIWGVNTYDIAADWWDKTVERMDLGVTFLEPWLDGSIILVDKDEPSETAVHSSDVYWNWIRPFDSTVWLLILFTVFLSGWVYQFIEYLQGERGDRTMWQWTRDNFYLSAINFSQNFEYEPTSSGAQIFGVSMTLFALLITATYTANLASLLVISFQEQGAVESIEHAVTQKLPICTFAGTASDLYIRSEYPRAKVVPQQNVLSAFQALQAGECELFATQKDNWLTQQGDSRYNPDCDMEWVGRTVLSIKSGFAVKGDAGWKCTTFIKDVLNVHMVEMISEGVLEQMKARHWWLIQQQHPADCSAAGGGGAGHGHGRRNRRLKASDNGNLISSESATGDDQRRKLKSAAASTDDENGAHALTLEHMLGTFVLHWALMAVALFVTICKAYKQGHAKEPTVSEAFITTYRQGSTKELTVKEAAMPESSKIHALSNSSKAQGKYAQLSAQDKALVDTMVDMLYQRSQIPDLEQSPEPRDVELSVWFDESAPLRDITSC